MITFPNAKINLGLNIVERRPDGYHNLETIFYPIPLQDILEVNTFEEAPHIVTPTNKDVELHSRGVAIDGDAEDNLVVKAYRLLKEKTALPPVHIHLFKRIPSGAGLGGGSADATFMLRLLREKFNLAISDNELEEVAARLGADCPFFVRNTPAFATGIGNIFTPMPSFTLKGYHILLVKPNIFVSTRDAFSLVKPQKPTRPLTEIASLPVDEWREAGMVNDFEESVFTKHPTIGRIKQQLYTMGARYAAMSGSGSSLFALFTHNPEQEANEIKRHHPDSFVWFTELMH